MKKIVLGVVFGCIIFVAFLYFGGASYVKQLGNKTVAVGKTLEGYEKELERAKKIGIEKASVVSEGVKDAYGKTKKGVGSSVEWTKESARNIAQKTRSGAADSVQWTKDEIGTSIDNAKETMVGGGEKEKKKE